MVFQKKIKNDYITQNKQKLLGKDKINKNIWYTSSLLIAISDVEMQIEGGI